MRLLVLNAGSSTVKFAVVETEAGEALGRDFPYPEDEKTGKNDLNLQYSVSNVDLKLHTSLVLLRK